MKILVFCPYYPPHIGGLESHADEFDKYLSQRGVDITVFTPQLPKSAPETETRHNNVEIIRFPAFEIISNYPLPKFWTKKYRELKKEIGRKNFDIVISRTRFFATSLMAFFYAKMRKTRWIHIEHGSDFVRLSSKFKTLLAKLYDHIFGRLIFKKSDLNISISKAVQKFVRKFDSRKSPIIYRGLDFGEIDKIQPDLARKEKYEDKIIISFAGRLYKWKGVENSIRAVKSLSEELKNKIAFLIVGDGEDFNRLQNLAEDDKSIVMLGNLPREKAIGILKISDIYIHSSLPGGGLSTSLLEAMHCGCAVIATPNEGAREVVRNNANGILMENPSHENMNRKLVELIESAEKRARYGQKAKEEIREKFDWKNSIDSYERIFENQQNQ